QQRLGARLGHDQATAVAAVAQDRGRATQGQGHRQRAGAGGGRRAGFGVPRQLVGQEQGPAAAERQAGHGSGFGRGGRPGEEIGVEGGQEVPAGLPALQAPHGSVQPVQAQAAAVAGQQQVPARERVAAGDAFQQQREAGRIGRLQAQQVGAGGQVADGHRNGRSAGYQIRRNTR